jgi:hypothetical protein
MTVTGVTVISNKSGFPRVRKHERLGRAVNAGAQLICIYRYNLARKTSFQYRPPLRDSQRNNLMGAVRYSARPYRWAACSWFRGDGSLDGSFVVPRRRLARRIVRSFGSTACQFGGVLPDSLPDDSIRRRAQHPAGQLTCRFDSAAACAATRFMYRPVTCWCFAATAGSARVHTV